MTVGGYGVLVHCHYAVLYLDEIIEGNDRIYGRATTYEVYCSTIAETEVARVAGKVLVLERSCALPDDPRGLTNGGYVLPDFAFLTKATIGSLLIVTVDRSRIRNVHQLVCAFIWKREGLSDLKLA